MAAIESIVCTGATGSIGAAIAAAFADAYPQARITATYRSSGRSLGSLNERSNVSLVRADLRRADEHAKLPANADVLVNCAGLASGKQPAAIVTAEEFDDLLDLNLKVPFLLIQRYLPGMLLRKFGRIVNINSIWGLRGSKANTAYTISKHGLSGLTKSVAKDYGHLGITCNEVCPGAVASRMMDLVILRIARESHRTIEEVQQQFVSSQNAGRFVTAEEVAHAAVFLAGVQAGGINGASLVVDGGTTA